MSSSEQAPEPTMDEILASIRKIIADDDQDSAGQGETAPAAAPVEPAASATGGQDSLVDDIANALNQPAGATASGAQGEEDIFDLTNEVPQQAPPAPQPEAAIPPGGPPAFEPQGQPAPDMPQMPGQPESSSGGMTATDASMSESGDVLAGSPMTETPVPDDATGFGAPTPESPPAEDFSADPFTQTPAHPEAGPEADSDAGFGHLDPFAGGAVPDPGAQAAPETEMPGAFAPEEAPAPSGSENGASLDTDGFAPGQMADMPATDTAAPAGDPASEETLAASATGLAGEEPEPAAPAEEAVLAMPAESPPETPEAVAASEGARSLDDSVREMIRPMLRQWLDENMPEIARNAVKEKLESENGDS